MTRQHRKNNDEVAIVLREIRRIQRDPFILDETKDESSQIEDTEGQASFQMMKQLLLKRPVYRKRSRETPPLPPPIPHTPTAKLACIEQISKDTRSLEKSIMMMRKMRPKLVVQNQYSSPQIAAPANDLKQRVQTASAAQRVLAPQAQHLNRTVLLEKPPVASKPRSYSVPRRTEPVNQQQKFHSLIRKLDMSQQFHDCHVILRDLRRGKKKPKQTVRFNN